VDQFRRSQLYRMWLDGEEKEVLNLTNLATSVLPEDVKSFFAREQMLGMIAQRIKNLDSFGELKELIQDKIKQKQEKQNENTVE
jgi:hypothetical protein